MAVYWIRGKEDSEKRGRDRKKDVIVIRDLGILVSRRIKAVIVGGEVPCSWSSRIKLAAVQSSRFNGA